MAQEILKLKDISVFSKGKAIIDNINLSVNKGELVAVMGESGSGKTTLLEVIDGWQTPNIGQVFMNTTGSILEDITKVPPHKRDIRMMTAGCEMFDNMNVCKNIAYGLANTNLSIGEVNKEVSKLTTELELKLFEHVNVNDLSGGQQQRVAFARTLIGRPGILLLDEPFCAVNDRIRIVMQGIVNKYRAKYGMTVIYTTHDEAAAKTFSDRIVKIKNGQIIE